MLFPAPALAGRLCQRIFSASLDRTTLSGQPLLMPVYQRPDELVFQPEHPGEVLAEWTTVARDQGIRAGRGWDYFRRTHGNP